MACWSCLMLIHSCYPADKRQPTGNTKSKGSEGKRWCVCVCVNKCIVLTLPEEMWMTEKESRDQGLSPFQRPFFSPVGVCVCCVWRGGPVCVIMGGGAKKPSCALMHMSRMTLPMWVYVSIAGLDTAETL